MVLQQGKKNLDWLFSDLPTWQQRQAGSKNGLNHARASRTKMSVLSVSARILFYRQGSFFDVCFLTSWHIPIMVPVLTLSRLSRFYLPALSCLCLPRLYQSFSIAHPFVVRTLHVPRMSTEVAIEDPYTWLEDVEAEESLAVSFLVQEGFGTRYHLFLTPFSILCSLQNLPMTNAWEHSGIRKKGHPINAFWMCWNPKIAWPMPVPVVLMKMEIGSCSIFGRMPRIPRVYGERLLWINTSRTILPGRRYWMWMPWQKRMVFPGYGKDHDPCLASGIL